MTGEICGVDGEKQRFTKSDYFYRQRFAEKTTENHYSQRFNWLENHLIKLSLSELDCYLDNLFLCVFEMILPLADEYRQMELQGTARLRDRERLQRKDRDREFPKRRRVDRSAMQQRSGGGESYRENENTDSSDEEYYEEEEETRIHQQNRMNQLSPTNSSLSNNRRGLRTLRSSPVLRAAADEILGVPVPRRARSGMLS